ncbi:hypothetical protein L7F22_016294 [Adiantum nelumboides]|nr:hypothetical protein [Adiantum nelumboides]
MGSLLRALYGVSSSNLFLLLTRPTGLRSISRYNYQQAMVLVEKTMQVEAPLHSPTRDSFVFLISAARSGGGLHVWFSNTYIAIRVFGILPEVDRSEPFSVLRDSVEGDPSFPTKRFAKQLSGTWPDRFSFISILSACENLVEGMLLHVSIIEHEFERDVLVGNALVSFYGRCGSMEDAQQIFQLMDRKDLVSWNAIIAVYAQCAEAKLAFVLFNMMKQENITPDRITFISLLSALANDTALFEGQYAHTVILDSEFFSDVSVGNALMAILDACVCEGSLAEGKRIHAFAINVGLFSDVIVASAVIHTYSKCRSLLDSQRAFELLTGRALLTWNTIIAAYSQSQQGPMSLLMFSRMLCEGVLPNHVTYVSVISACSHRDTFFNGNSLHAVIIASNVWGDIGVETSLIHMYGMHGLPQVAEKLFCRLLSVNLVTWNALIAAYARHELLDKVEGFCSLMYLQGILPDKVTFLSTLSSCTHPNDLVVGKQTHTRILWSTCKDDVLVASALVNMYGKCDSLEDAYKIFESTERYSVSCWNALLGAYFQNGYGMFSLQVFNRMQCEGVKTDRVRHAQQR